jgi:hypothetical protein
MTRRLATMPRSGLTMPSAGLTMPTWVHPIIDVRVRADPRRDRRDAPGVAFHAPGNRLDAPILL